MYWIHIYSHVLDSRLQAEGVTYAGQRQAMRQRTYSVLSDIKTGHAFAPMVAPPSETHDGHPGITWEAFHKVGISAFDTEVVRHIFGASIHCLGSWLTHHSGLPSGL